MDNNLKNWIKAEREKQFQEFKFWFSNEIQEQKRNIFVFSVGIVLISMAIACSLVATSNKKLIASIQETNAAIRLDMADFNKELKAISQDIKASNDLLRKDIENRLLQLKKEQQK